MIGLEIFGFCLLLLNNALKDRDWAFRLKRKNLH